MGKQRRQGAPPTNEEIQEYIAYCESDENIERFFSDAWSVMDQMRPLTKTEKKLKVKFTYG